MTYEFFKIEKGVPLPGKYRWTDMELNDSVHFPTDDAFIKARNSAHEWGKYNQYKFVTNRKRRRIWRVE